MRGHRKTIAYAEKARSRGSGDASHAVADTERSERQGFASTRTANAARPTPALVSDVSLHTSRHLAATWRRRRTAREQIEIDALYSGYLERQSVDIEAFKRDEDLGIPSIDYGAVGGLSTEVRQKLAAARPVTLGQAGRIEGVTPAALLLLLAHLKSPPARKSA